MVVYNLLYEYFVYYCNVAELYWFKKLRSDRSGRFVLVDFGPVTLFCSADQINLRQSFRTGSIYHSRRSRQTDKSRLAGYDAGVCKMVLPFQQQD